MNNTKSKNDSIELTLPLDAAYVSAARRTASSVSERMGFSTEAVEDIKMAVSEACIYIIKHSCLAGAEHFHIMFTMENDKNLTISLYAKVQELVPQEESPEDKIGLQMMEALVNDLQIIAQSDGIDIKMLKENRRVHFIEGD